MTTISDAAALRVRGAFHDFRTARARALQRFQAKIAREVDRGASQAAIARALGIAPQRLHQLLAE